MSARRHHRRRGTRAAAGRPDGGRLLQRGFPCRQSIRLLHSGRWGRCTATPHCGSPWRLAVPTADQRSRSRPPTAGFSFSNRTNGRVGRRRFRRRLAHGSTRSSRAGRRCRLRSDGGRRSLHCTPGRQAALEAEGRAAGYEAIEVAAPATATPVLRGGYAVSASPPTSAMVLMERLAPRVPSRRNETRW